jgi:hypothetical protein
MAMAIVASNALALVQAAMRQQDGREAVEELSCYYLVLFVSRYCCGRSSTKCGKGSCCSGIGARPDCASHLPWHYRQLAVKD